MGAGVVFSLYNSPFSCCLLWKRKRERERAYDSAFSSFLAAY